MTLPEPEVIALLDLLAWEDDTVVVGPYRDWHLWDSPASLTSTVRLRDARAVLTADSYPPTIPLGVSA